MDGSITPISVADHWHLCFASGAGPSEWLASKLSFRFPLLPRLLHSQHLHNYHLSRVMIVDIVDLHFSHRSPRLVSSAHLV